MAYKESKAPKVDKPGMVPEGANGTRGADLIKAERARQIEEEGFKPMADALWPPGTLAKMALCYAWAGALPPANRRRLADIGWFSSPFLQRMWPVAHEWWKPTTPERDLVKAGALIAAELDAMAHVRETGGEDV